MDDEAEHTHGATCATARALRSPDKGGKLLCNRRHRAFVAENDCHTSGRALFLAEARTSIYRLFCSGEGGKRSPEFHKVKQKHGL